jgi:hypothetical protein
MGVNFHRILHWFYICRSTYFVFLILTRLHGKWMVELRKSWISHWIDASIHVFTKTIWDYLPLQSLSTKKKWKKNHIFVPNSAASTSVQTFFFHIFLYFKIEEVSSLKLFWWRHESMRLVTMNRMVYFIFWTKDIFNEKFSFFEALPSIFHVNGWGWGKQTLKRVYWSCFFSSRIRTYDSIYGSRYSVEEDFLSNFR